MSRDAWLTLFLAPVLVLQALWVIARARRLPEPDGPRAGTIGNGPDMRLLVLGDSSAAGVGVEDQSDALTPQLAAHLSKSGRRVHWQLAARNGATCADARDLLASLATPHVDVAFVVFGVNDVKNMRRNSVWRRDLTRLIERLQNDHGAPLVWFSGLPPMAEFPLLPNPLAHILGQRAARFEHTLSEICATSAAAELLRVDLPLSSEFMATDGFHPNAKLYQIWARHVADTITARLRGSSTTEPK